MSKPTRNPKPKPGLNLNLKPTSKTRSKPNTIPLPRRCGTQRMCTGIGYETRSTVQKQAGTGNKVGIRMGPSPSPDSTSYDKTPNPNPTGR